MSHSVRRTLRRSWRPVALLGTLSLLAGGLIVVAAGPAWADTCAGGTCTATFTVPGSSQSWTVPSGVTQITVTAYGASGGKDSLGDPGAAGGAVEATLTVSPDDSLSITVGGVGGNASGDVPGAGGGSALGDGGSGGTGTTYAGGGGGGSTVVAESSAPLVMAGGGGGAGTGGGAAGSGGAIYGGSGLDGAAGAGSTGGGGASTSAAGAAGGDGASDGTGPAVAGRTGTGGAGGSSGANGGGGGGGGYYGGGGGGVDGGGGGAGYGPAGAYAPQDPTFPSNGNGEVIISYSEPTPPPSGGGGSSTGGGSTSGGGEGSYGGGAGGITTVTTTVPSPTTQVLTFGLAPIPVPGNYYNPYATSNDPNAQISFAVSAQPSGACAITSGIVDFQAAGTCTLTATAPADAGYTAATAQETIKIWVPVVLQFTNVTWIEPSQTVWTPAYSETPQGTVGLSTTGSCSVVNGGQSIQFGTSGVCSVTASTSGTSTVAPDVAEVTVNVMPASWYDAVLFWLGGVDVNFVEP